MPKTPLKQRADSAEDKLREMLYRFRHPIFLVIVGVVALLARLALWPRVSGDFVEFLDLWMNEIRDGRGFHSIGVQVGNYTAPYHYLMALMSYIPGLDNLSAIKIPSIIADFCMAAAVGLLLWRLTANRAKAAIGAALVLCLPTVLLNGAAWGQCDAMYTSLIIAFFCLYLDEKPAAAVFMFGFALSVKLQAIFVLPALIIFWLCGKLRLRHFLWGAAGYVIPFVPAMIAGGSLEPLWRAYAMQTKVMSFASNIPNLASLFTGIVEDDLATLSPAFILTCVAVLGAVAMMCWSARSRFTKESAFLVLALCACLVPFLLPAMRDRYYYMAEVLCLVYAVARSNRAAAPVLMQLASLPSYVYYLFHGEHAFGPWRAVMVLAVICLLWMDLRRNLAPDDGEPTAPAKAPAPAEEATPA